MKLYLYSILMLLCTVSVLSSGKKKHKVIAIDERWICNIKKSCNECLKFSQCSWCATNNKCFSKTLLKSGEFCKNDTIGYEDFGFSVAENAECVCAGGKLESRCYPPGVTEGAVCFGRGKCVCGRCICDATPFPDQPTKTVMGEYCDYDNFSCDGLCNEGPYSISEPRTGERSLPIQENLEMPTE